MSDKEEIEDLIGAFKKYCENPDIPPVLNQATIGYIRHCLAEAQRNAERRGDVIDISDHQLFALMVVETERPDLVSSFLIDSAKEFERLNPGLLNWNLPS
jgi:hypothetical protein